MNIIIPMAGIGKRMRPHTLTIPKPLLPIAGKPIVQRLIEEIAKLTNEKINEIAFVIGNFGIETETMLIEIAKNLNATAKLYYQHEALGTAHAVWCAKESLHGKTIVAFADTLFKANFILETNSDGLIWVQPVNNPENFGVVIVDNNNIITELIEKPKKAISNLAIIGIYYFKEGQQILNEIQYLIDNNIKGNNEFQLTDALENLKNKGVKIKVSKVDEWLDCGNKDATVYTNQRILEHAANEKLIDSSAKIENSMIIKPCYIGSNVIINNSIIGPHVSIGNNTEIKNSLIKNSIIQNNSIIENINTQNSMIGNYVAINGKLSEYSIGDYTIIRQ